MNRGCTVEKKVRLERVMDQYMLDLVNKKLLSREGDRLQSQHSALVGISEAIAYTKI